MFLSKWLPDLRCGSYRKEGYKLLYSFKSTNTIRMAKRYFTFSSRCNHGNKVKAAYQGLFVS